MSLKIRNQNLIELKDMNLACFGSFHPVPVTIDSLAYSSELNIVAEGLADGSIRFRDPVSLAVTGCISGSPTRSARRIVFYNKFLISCGVHGSVSMWDTETLSECSSVESSQGAVWDMALKNDRLYIATETGCVVVLALSEGDMRVSGFLRSGSRSGTPVRALSVCIEGDHLFVGDAKGTISRWNISKEVCDTTLSVPSKNNMPTLIWSLVACGKGRIASGDSTGTVSLWDTASCTLLQARQDHQADVLTMHMMSNGTDLFTAGVDARVARYKVSLGSENERDRLNFISISSLVSRDVFAMTTVGNLILVGGSDARIGVASIDISSKFSSVKLDRFSQDIIIVRNGMVFAREEGWSVVKVFRQELVAELDNKTPLSSFCVSPDAKRVALIGVDKKVTVLSLEADTISLVSSYIINGFATASAMSENLTVIAYPGHLAIVSEAAKVPPRVIAMKTAAFVTRLFVLNDDTIFAVAGRDLYVVSSHQNSKEWTQKSLAHFDSVITALDESSLTVATADNVVHSYSFKDPSCVELEQVSRRRVSKKLKIPPYTHINHIVKGSCLCLFGESFVLTSSGETSAFKLNPSASLGGVILGAAASPVDAQPSSKRLKTDESAAVGEGECILTVLADSKSTSKFLISPFERRSFQD